jgi:NADPH-dependent curcumin reductase CurA
VLKTALPRRILRSLAPEANQGKLQKMTNLKNQEIVLKSFPVGMPTADNFDVVSSDVREPGEGEFVVRNQWMSVDPYMRGRMTQQDSYIPGFAAGQTLEGGAIGKVEVSNNADFPVGTLVSTMFGWRDYFVTDGNMVNKVDAIEGIDNQAFLGTLGMPGMTAYVGLLRIASMQDGENVFISAASGAVGAVACQIAKARGCYVVGSAGSDEKCQWLKDECGVDEVINYKKFAGADALTAELQRLFPKGIDVYFENVGGDHLQAALNAMAMKGRIAFCGMISMYNATEAVPGPSNLAMIIGKELNIGGFIVSNHFDMFGDFYSEVGQLIRDGKMKWQETILEGIENAPQAFFNLFTGDNFGKMLVKLDPEG